MAEDLMRDFGVQSCSLGILGAFYYNAYASLQVPVGLMLDRLGSHRIIPAAISFCTVGAFLFSFAEGLAEASIARLLMGAGSACAFIGTIKLITLWFPPHRKALMIGLTMTFGTVGATLGTAQLPIMMDSLGWRSSMQTLGIAGGVLALMSFFLISASPGTVSDDKRKTKQEAQPSLKVLEGLKIVIGKPQIWLIALFGCLMYVPLAAIADLWGIPFLTKMYTIDRGLAGLYISSIFWGLCLGGPLVSYLSDRFQRRRPFMVASTLLSAFVYGIIIFYPGLPVFAMIGCLFLGGLFFGGQVLCFSCITESLPLWTSGVAVGFANMIIMSSGVIFEPLVGFLLDYFWTGEKLDGIPLYSIETFRLSLSPVFFSLIIAFFVTLFIRESFPKKEVSPRFPDSP
tara:strand:+ start:455 stop:1654 length:1200 start_codon:yes stop_codon:yes gene_type:complete